MNKVSEAFGRFTKLPKLLLRGCEGLEEFPLALNNSIMFGFEEDTKGFGSLRSLKILHMQK